MSKRKYTQINIMETQIVSMRKAGMTRQEIADELGLTKNQIKDWITHYNRRKDLHRSLQDGIQADGKSSAGYDPAGNEEGEKESRCGVAAPQRPRLSIYIPSIF